jgi:hypothetical protein
MIKFLENIEKNRHGNQFHIRHDGEFIQEIKQAKEWIEDKKATTVKQEKQGEEKPIDNKGSEEIIPTDSPIQKQEQEF